jgi:dATP pyrophosphohydrolase
LEPFKRPESSLVVIYNQDNKVLLLQRDDDAEFWQSVTGSLEYGESPIITAYREVAEETGIVLSPMSRCIQDCHTVNQYRIRTQWQHRYPPSVYVNTEYVFAVCVQSPVKIILTEHTDYQWLDKHMAAARVWSETNRMAIEKFVPEAK